MKKFAFVGILALAAGMIVVPVQAADDDGDKKFKVHGEIRSRWVYLENATDLTDSDDPGDAFDDTLSFIPYRVRIGVSAEFAKNVSGYVEIQNTGNFGNESPQRGFQSSIGQGNVNIDDSEIDLYQAWIAMREIGGTNLSLRLGRQELVMGTELFIGDNDYYNGQTFDGLTGDWEFENWTLHFGALTIEDRNLNFGVDCGAFAGSSCRDDNVELYSVGSSFDLGGDMDMILEPYLLYYRDGSGTSGVDPAGNPGAKVYTIGARFVRDLALDDDRLIDWNAELAFQTGDVDVNGVNNSGGTGTDLSAYIFEGWIGFNFGDEDLHHRFSAGYLATSGDDDFGDDDNEAFFPLFGDMHANNRLGNIDFGGMELSGVIGAIAPGLAPPGLDTGIEDISIAYNGVMGNHTWLVAIHILTAAEIDPAFFSIGPRAFDDELGEVFDIAYGYTYSKNLSFAIEASTFSPGDFFEDAAIVLAGPGSSILQDDIMRFAAQARLRW